MNRTIRTLSATTLIAGLGLAGLIPMTVLADTAKAIDSTVGATAPSATTNPAIVQLSQAGFETLRAASGARIAIFNGNPDMAKTLITTALGDVKTAEKDAGTLAADGSFVPMSDSSMGDLWIPVDGRIALADNFVATPEKVASLQQANEHLKNGEHQRAIEVLKLASVDVSYTRVLMPLKTTQGHLQAASDFAAKGQFYEANLAIKAIEDGLRIDTVELVKSAT